MSKHQDVKTVGAGVIGLGFMGQTHARAYCDAGALLVAVCDRSAERRSGLGNTAGNLGAEAVEPLFDPALVFATDSLDAFLATDGLDVVSVCTPTDTHVEIAIRALRAGKHVVVEKPVALTSVEVESLSEEAAKASRLCMPAMCMRFWPAWAWAAEVVESGRYGRLRAARFERIGAPPAWNASFYGDAAKSGGALFDLHVHDTDFITHLLGKPDAVLSSGDVSHVSTVYRFADGPGDVSAEGGWMPSSGWPFTMRMRLRFDDAVVAFDLGCTPSLRVFASDGSVMSPDVSDVDGWQAEIRAMVKAVARGDREPPATMASAAATTRVLEAEAESLRTGEAVRVS